MYPARASKTTHPTITSNKVNMASSNPPIFCCPSFPLDVITTLEPNQSSDTIGSNDACPPQTLQDVDIEAIRDPVMREKVRRINAMFTNYPTFRLEMFLIEEYLKTVDGDLGLAIRGIKDAMEKARVEAETPIENEDDQKYNKLHYPEYARLNDEDYTKLKDYAWRIAGNSDGDNTLERYDEVVNSRKPRPMHSIPARYITKSPTAAKSALEISPLDSSQRHQIHANSCLKTFLTWANSYDLCKAEERPKNTKSILHVPRCHP